jgi:potassium-transporting ATPase KdpC subunit
MIKAFKIWVWMTFLTGVAYPLLITAVAHITAGKKARGSTILHEGRIVGSALIGQKFSSEKYFWSRPSSSDYHTLPAQGSHLGPTSAKLKEQVLERKKKWEVYGSDVPSELLFASGSGVDPHLTAKGAIFQIGRIAEARKLPPEVVQKLIDKHIVNMVGLPLVNVLKLNLALDQMEEKNG